MVTECTSNQSVLREPLPPLCILLSQLRWSLSSSVTATQETVQEGRDQEPEQKTSSEQAGVQVPDTGEESTDTEEEGKSPEQAGVVPGVAEESTATEEEGKSPEQAGVVPGAWCRKEHSHRGGNGGRK